MVAMVCDVIALAFFSYKLGVVHGKRKCLNAFKAAHDELESRGILTPERSDALEVVMRHFPR